MFVPKNPDNYKKFIESNPRFLGLIDTYALLAGNTFFIELDDLEEIVLGWSRSGPIDDYMYNGQKENHLQL